MSNKRHRISFRIDDELAEQLDDARKPFGLSRHDWARGVLVAWLTKSEEIELNQELISLKHEMEQFEPKLELLLSRSLFTILTVGLNVDANDAKAAVEEIFLQ